MFVNLEEYGFDSSYMAFTDNESLEALIPARVIESRREQFRVMCEHGEISAGVKGRFFHNLKEGDLFPVAGDFVLITYNPHGLSLIDSVLPRRSKFSRVDFLGRKEGFIKNLKEQVSAANFDYVFILSSLNHDLNLKRLARYLTASLQSGAVPVFVLTKSDLVDGAEIHEGEVRKMVDGIQTDKSTSLATEISVISVSCKTGAGIEKLSPFLQPQKTAVLLGSSGVGKSSLLNYLAGENIMEVKTIREDDSKGRHTTTYRHLFKLPSGAMIIDTPGIRELGLWDSREGISLAFADIEALITQCRFNNCTHQSEPGCAILAALEDGTLMPEQWKTYQAQVRETSFVMNHSAYLKQKKEFGKSIARFSREVKKGKKDFDD